MAPPTHSLHQPHFPQPALVHTGTIDWPKFLKRTLFTSGCFDCDQTIAGKTVLITGAAGSIGFALARRLMNSLADTLVLLDRSQQNLHALYQEYRERNVTIPRVKFFCADILSEGALQEIFAECYPQIVFHAAAMKHLPQLEHMPFLALKNNVLGTLRLLQFIDGFDVEHFINVSTDKAVNPTSVLGVSKRIAELVFLAVEPAAGSLASLRLGNVLGSSGSVVPRFIQCLEACRPLTVTDTHASRYFITLEEAVAFLISTLEAPANSLLLPDMGGPRKILELAAFLHSEFYGDVDAECFRLTGLRDGEKLFEQLTYDYERLADTAVPRLHKICGSRALDPEEFADKLGLLLEIVTKRQKAGFIEALSTLVPEFTPSQTLLRYVH